MSVVIAHRSIYMAEELRDLVLSLGVELPGPIRMCSDLAGVRADFDAHGAPLVLVTEVDLPGGGRQSGVALAREMRERWSDVPICVVAPMHDQELSNALRGLSSVALICEGSSLEREFRHTMRRMLTPAGTAAANEPSHPARYDVNFRLFSDGNCSYEVRSFNAAIPHTLQIRFGIDPQRLNALIEKTAKLSRGAAWRDDFQLIGFELTKTLIKEQADIAHDLGFLEGISAVSPSKVGLCFTVDRSLYPIAFEAIGLPRSSEYRYWLEQSPLWRRLPEIPMDRIPLFSYVDARQQPVNCLLINANCGGETQINIGAGDPTGQPSAVKVGLTPLTGVEPEIEAILDEVMEAPPGCVGRIGHIWMKDGVVHTTVRRHDGTTEDMTHYRSFDQVLKDFLTTGEPWHLVHFAGHSHFIGEGKNAFGYVFLPVRGQNAHDMPKPKALGIPQLAQWLQHSRFVYLSGCVSSHHDFVFHLCSNNVPAMSGFRWAVNDALACEHSAHFYRSLFRTRSIEQALQETWVDMYANHRNDWVWASSQFVIHSTA